MRAFSRLFSQPAYASARTSKPAYASPSRCSSTQASVCTWEDHDDDAHAEFLACLASQGVTEDYRVPKEQRKEVMEKRKEVVRRFEEISRMFDFSGDPAYFAYSVERAHKREVYESEGIALEETSMDEGDAVMDSKFDEDKNQGNLIGNAELDVDDGGSA